MKIAFKVEGNGWSGMRQEHSVIPTKLKDEVYKNAIKPAMTYGAECWRVREKDEGNWT